MAAPGLQSQAIQNVLLGFLACGEVAPYDAPAAELMLPGEEAPDREAVLRELDAVERRDLMGSGEQGMDAQRMTPPNLEGKGVAHASDL